jgi:DNA helicase II / ATP-dependent DNA helicase PcrA
MDLSPILNPLNDAQREAVTAPVGPVLVLAGAGSGKTRVLTHRIVWCVQAENASPHSILAVTFTNKAAGEMRARIEQLLGVPGGALWVGTFHGIAHRLLRLHWREAGLPQTFQILDGDDQLRIIKKLIKAQGLDDTRWVPREVQWFINSNKDEGHRPKHLKDGNDPTRRQLIKLYQDYEDQCQRTGVVDFAELLLRAFELWRDHPEVLAHYRRRFRHVLVDEFQDTNAIQYAWTKLLVGSDGAPFVVGDDDQSIYRWRGARVENLQQYRRDFPTTKLVRLEQNYRSTGTILNAANALIAHNNGRLGKNLWTSGEKGEPIRLYAAFNERDEAEFVMQRIREWVRAAGSGAKSRCCTARTRSRACSKKCSCRRARRIASTVACGISSAPKSRMRSATCGSRPIAATTPRSSASSTCRPAALARAASKSSASMPKARAARCGRPRPPASRAMRSAPRPPAPCTASCS